MTNVHIECSQCGSDDYKLMDPKTGEVQCPFCRKRWIVVELIQKTETEKLLTEQTNQPMSEPPGLPQLGGCAKAAIGVLIGFVVLVLIIIIGLMVFRASLASLY